MAKTKKAFIISKFNDVGTGQSYAAGTLPNVEEGAFANYKAAGLLRVPTAEDMKNAKAAGAA